MSHYIPYKLTDLCSSRGLMWSAILSMAILFGLMSAGCKERQLLMISGDISFPQDAKPGIGLENISVFLFPGNETLQFVQRYQNNIVDGDSAHSWREYAPYPIYGDRTDREGKFRLATFSPGKYAVAARFSTIDGRATYYWLGWIEVSKNIPACVSLSDKNMLDKNACKQVINWLIWCDFQDTYMRASRNATAQASMSIARQVCEEVELGKTTSNGFYAHTRGVAPSKVFTHLDSGLTEMIWTFSDGSKITASFLHRDSEGYSSDLVLVDVQIED